MRIQSPGYRRVGRPITWWLDLSRPPLLSAIAARGTRPDPIQTSVKYHDPPACNGTPPLSNIVKQRSLRAVGRGAMHTHTAGRVPPGSARKSARSDPLPHSGWPRRAPGPGGITDATPEVLPRPCKRPPDRSQVRVQQSSGGMPAGWGRPYRFGFSYQAE